MKLVVSSGGVPAGSYQAAFKEAEAVDNDYGPGLRWVFEVASGPYAGQKTSRITAQTPTPKNACGRILAGLLGKKLTADEEIDLSNFVGNTYLIVVAETQTGMTRVETVTRLPDTQ